MQEVANAQICLAYHSALCNHMVQTYQLGDGLGKLRKAVDIVEQTTNLVR